LDELSLLPDDATLGRKYADAAFRALGNNFNGDELFAGSPRDALRRAERGLEIQPRNPFLLLARAYALQAVGRLRDAADEFDALVEVTDGAPRASAGVWANAFRSSMGLAILPDRAVAAIALLEPDDVVRGMAQEQLEDYDGALDTFELAGEHQRRGMLLMRLGRMTEATAELALAHERSSNEFMPAVIYAQALATTGELEKADEVAGRALELECARWTANLIAAEIAALRNDRGRAVRYLSDAIDMVDPNCDLTPTEAATLCRLLWDLSDDGAPLERYVERVGHELGQSLLSLIPQLVRDPEKSRLWIIRWASAAVEESEVPIGMAQAAVEFARTQNRAHLLALPSEQREIVIELLERRQDGV
jgi:tetratricopeptide (TPR) repeat protein